MLENFPAVITVDLGFFWPYMLIAYLFVGCWAQAYAEGIPGKIFAFLCWPLFLLMITISGWP